MGVRSDAQGTQRYRLTNVEIMVPFVCTLKECREVIDLLARTA